MEKTSKIFYRVFYTATDNRTGEVFYNEHEDFDSLQLAYRFASLMQKDEEPLSYVSFKEDIFRVTTSPDGEKHLTKMIVKLSASHRKRRGGTAPNRDLLALKEFFSKIFSHDEWKDTDDNP